MSVHMYIYYVCMYLVTMYSAVRLPLVWIALYKLHFFLYY